MPNSRVDSSTLLSRFRLVKGCRCPSQNRTCGFPAYGSSNSLRLPAPDIHLQLRLRNVEIPNSQEFLKPHAPLLVSAVQHTISTFTWCIRFSIRGSSSSVWNLIPAASFSIPNALLWHRPASTAEAIVCHRLRSTGFHRLHHYYAVIRLLSARRVLSICKTSIPLTACGETVRPPRYACNPLCARHALLTPAESPRSRLSTDSCCLRP